MWQILQHEYRDFVHNEMGVYSVRDFVKLAFKKINMDIKWVGTGVNEKGFDIKTGKCLVEVDPRYFRPSEVEELLGDPTKAKKILGGTEK